MFKTPFVCCTSCKRKRFMVYSSTALYVCITVTSAPNQSHFREPISFIHYSMILFRIQCSTSSRSIVCGGVIYIRTRSRSSCSVVDICILVLVFEYAGIIHCRMGFSLPTLFHTGTVLQFSPQQCYCVVHCTVTLLNLQQTKEARSRAGDT